MTTPDPHADCCPRAMVTLGYCVTLLLGVLAGAGGALLVCGLWLGR